jgi:hypothetical protein
VGERSPSAYDETMRWSGAFVPLLLTACSFDRSGLPGSGDGPIPSIDRVSGPDALLDILDPCTPNPCQNGGTCARGDGGAVCKCAKGFDGPLCNKCALGHAGASCAACPQTKRTIQSCAHASIACSKWIDGDDQTMTTDQCMTSGCFATDIDFDLGSRQFVNRLRFLSDWWNKRPGTWELLASDDNDHFSLVMDARSNNAPWQCTDGDPCTAEVPEECCPGGGTQSGVGAKLYPKWDDFTFSGLAARYWRFRIKTTDDRDSLIMRELELYGHDCLGELACATPSCGTGVCTGQETAFCACVSCQKTASCTSAFTGAAPPCTTPTS